MCQNNQQLTTVVLAYDLDTSTDANINNEIKGYLQEEHWQDTVAGDYQYVQDYYTTNGLQLPQTTLVKFNSTIEQARLQFDNALDRYNINHANDNTMRMAHYTRAAIFAVDNYELLPRR